MLRAIHGVVRHLLLEAAEAAAQAKETSPDDSELSIVAGAELASGYSEGSEAEQSGRDRSESRPPDTPGTLWPEAHLGRSKTIE